MMERIAIEPRPNWTQEIEAIGFDFYTSGGVPYWTESAYYAFTAAEIDEVEEAANKLHQLRLYAVDRVITERLFPFFGISPEFAEFITASWIAKEPALYGRFDIIWGGAGSAEPPKMLEYNADTPTSLFEASIVQWNWREQRFPGADQFNSIEETMIERWQAFMVGQRNADILYVTTATPCPEDETTVQYIGETARRAGYKAVKFLPIQEIGWNPDARQFRDIDDLPMKHVFKLYPWEWMMRDANGANVLRALGMKWWEPPWKAILSNKAILPVLWEMFPEHPNLLPAYREPEPLSGSAFVKKPLLGREGANVTICSGDGKLMQYSGGPYSDSGYIYQGYAEAPLFGDGRPNLGVWVVGDSACGMGVREETLLIINNRSRFVPHLFE